MKSWWNKIFGIIAIALAVFDFSILCSFLIWQGGVSGMLLAKNSLGWIPGAALTHDSLIVIILDLALTVMLLLAGIGLLRRRQWACELVRGWGVFKLITMIFNVTLTTIKISFFMVVSFFVNYGKGSVGIEELLPIISIYASMLIYNGFFPVTVLIWFSRSSIKNDVLSWKGAVPYRSSDSGWGGTV